MMNLEQRIGLLGRLGKYMLGDSAGWQSIVTRAHRENPWFIPEFINYQARHIATAFLDRGRLEEWISRYRFPFPDRPAQGAENIARNVGIVMAGNIPLAGFHDFLSVFLSGHRQTIKPSSKDLALISGVVAKLTEWEPETGNHVSIAGRLNGCDAYIATGSNNSARYFDFYFGNYPHIIRRNRTSAAVLSGNETRSDLEALADDVYLYFGLGCRSVTKIFVPPHYDFIPLLEAFRKYNRLSDHSKYRNNYDYQLAILLIDKSLYMTNGSILLQEHQGLFPPIGRLYYEFYETDPSAFLESSPDIQCVAGSQGLPFGKAQQPALDDYADGADTLQFLRDLA